RSARRRRHPRRPGPRSPGRTAARRGRRRPPRARPAGSWRRSHLRAPSWSGGSRGGPGAGWGSRSWPDPSPGRPGRASVVPGPAVISSPAEAYVSWWAPQSSKLVRPSISVWRVRFPSASAKSAVRRRADAPIPCAGGPVPQSPSYAEGTTTPGRGGHGAIGHDAKGPGTAGPGRSGPGVEDPRRRIPRTDRLLALPEVVAASGAMGERVVHDLVRDAQDRARRGEIAPEDVAAAVLASLGEHSASS